MTTNDIDHLFPNALNIDDVKGENKFNPVEDGFYQFKSNLLCCEKYDFKDSLKKLKKMNHNLSESKKKKIENAIHEINSEYAPMEKFYDLQIKKHEYIEFLKTKFNLDVKPNSSEAS